MKEEQFKKLLKSVNKIKTDLNTILIINIIVIVVSVGLIALTLLDL